MTMPFTKADVDAAVALHEELHQWLKQWLKVAHPDTNTHVVITALSYEIGLMVGISTLEPSVLREHILAVRRGLVQ
jgi:hypothetical protein